MHTNLPFNPIKKYWFICGITVLQHASCAQRNRLHIKEEASVEVIADDMEGMALKERGEMRKNAKPSKYFHYTNTFVLKNLPNTNFCLTSLNNLISTYRVAPFSGEVFKGGAEGLRFRKYIYFTGIGTHRYKPHHQMIEEYSSPQSQTFYSSVGDIEYDLEKRNINEVIVKLLRQYCTLSSITDEYQDKLLVKIEEAVNHIYSGLILAYVSLKFLIIGRPKMEEDRESMARDMYNINAQHAKELIDLIMKDQDDVLFNKIKDYYREVAAKYPSFSIVTTQNKRNFCLSPDQKFIDKEFQYSLARYKAFSCIADYIKAVTKIISPKENVTNDSLNYAINSHIPQLKNSIKGTIEREILLKDIICGNIQLAEKQNSYFMHNASIDLFPVVFIYDKEDTKLQPLHGGGEYVATDDLQLGKDITKIAVPKDKIDIVKEFFRRYNMDNRVEILDINFLEEDSNVYKNKSKL